MSSSSIACKKMGCHTKIEITEKSVIDKFLNDMANLYHTTTTAGSNAAQYWSNLAETSKSPLAPFAHVPGVFAVLWTPEVAPTTAITLGTAGYGFFALPKNLVHFTTAAGARGIAATGAINATKYGAYGPGVYMTKVGPPLNAFIRAEARFPIHVATPAGTVRIYPRLIYVRWGGSPLRLP